MKDILTLIAAFGGTIAFAHLFGTPKRYYLLCGLIGFAGWGSYLLLRNAAGMSVTVSTFFATIAVVLISRIAAVRTGSITPVFMICGLFPLIPGGTVYWCTYYLVAGDMALARANGFLACKIVFAMVIGIVMIQEIPRKVFIAKQ